MISHYIRVYPKIPLSFGSNMEFHIYSGNLPRCTGLKGTLRWSPRYYTWTSLSAKVKCHGQKGLSHFRF